MESHDPHAVYRAHQIFDTAPHLSGCLVGECNGEDCPVTYRKKVLEADVEYYTYLGTGNYFFHVEMEEGETYKLTFTAEGVTYTLYGGENADVEMTLTDGAFTCTETGTYYYVVTVSEDIPAHESYIVEIVVAD